ncbi:MAG: carboxypeptidase-like regulatory domain-containing protein [Desulfobacterales bacterium]|nr:carboxypeptidase-like regulatory domain-containing protein [Desulfobacterales bacterium]
MKSLRSLSMTVFTVLLLAGVLSAQAPTAGRIIGTVKDDQGAPLPGVTVEAKSPRLVGIGGRRLRHERRLPPARASPRRLHHHLQPVGIHRGRPQRHRPRCRTGAGRGHRHEAQRHRGGGLGRRPIPAHRRQEHGPGPGPDGRDLQRPAQGPQLRFPRDHPARRPERGRPARRHLGRRRLGRRERFFRRRDGHLGPERRDPQAERGLRFRRGGPVQGLRL